MGCETKTPVFLHLRSLARLVPSHRKFGANVNPITVNRWILYGVTMPNGATRRLQAVRTPKGWLSTEEWLNDFLEALAGEAIEAQDKPAADPIRAPVARRKAHERAERELAAAGF